MRPPRHQLSEVFSHAQVAAIFRTDANRLSEANRSNLYERVFSVLLRN